MRVRRRVISSVAKARLSRRWHFTKPMIHARSETTLGAKSRALTNAGAALVS
jgi:hypothetical protein